MAGTDAAEIVITQEPKMPVPYLSHAAKVSAAVCVLYGSTSLILSLVNKALFATYNFNAIFTLLSAQMLISVAVCTISRDYWGNPLNVPDFSWGLLRKALPIGFLYVCNVSVGLVAMKLVNLPMFFAIRKLVSPTLLTYELVVYGKMPEQEVAVAVGLIGAGVLVAGWDALTADWFGYGVTMVNNIFSASQMVVQKQFNMNTKTSAFGIVYLNALIAGPVTVALALATGEAADIAAYPHLYSSAFWAAFLTVSCLGLLLTFSSTLCTTHNSPLATSITGNVKDVATTTLGWVLFADGPPVTVKSVGGVALSFAGAFLYSALNLRRQAGTARMPAPAPLPDGASGSKETAAIAQGDDPLQGAALALPRRSADANVSGHGGGLRRDAHSGSAPHTTVNIENTEPGGSRSVGEAERDGAPLPHLRIHTLLDGGPPVIPVSTPGGSVVDITQTMTASGTPRVAASPRFGDLGRSGAQMHGASLSDPAASASSLRRTAVVGGHVV